MQRFKTRPQFQAALASAVVAKTTHFALHHVRLESAAGGSKKNLFHVHDIWTGAMVPKRWAKRAVTRNSIKRQIYTAITSLGDTAAPAAYLIRLRRDFSRQLFLSASSAALKQAVRTELQVLMQIACSAVPSQKSHP